MARAPANERHHRTLLEEKPDDPNVHNNYGAFLLDKRDDPVGAERHYLRAIEIDPGHSNALGNLGNLRWRQRRLDEADALYRRALGGESPVENVVWNYVRFRRTEFGDLESTAELLDSAIKAHPNSGRLRVLRAESLLKPNPSAALVELQAAREQGADQTIVEPLHAFAVHMAGRPTKECIAAYRTAIAVNPDNGALHLNLSQLLFTLGEAREAKKELSFALSAGLDPAAELEAILYSVAHLNSPLTESLDRVRELLAAGAMLDWDVAATLDAVAKNDAKRAEQLRILVRVMQGDLGVERLPAVAAELKS